VFELLLEIDAMDYQFGPQWKPLSENIEKIPIDLFADVKETELHESAYDMAGSFEWSYYDEFWQPFVGLRRLQITGDVNARTFQALFCIDDREDSFQALS